MATTQGIGGVVDNVLRLAEKYVGSDNDVLLLLGLLAAFALVIIAILSVVLRKKEQNPLTARKLGSAIEDLNIRVSDYISKTNNEVFKLSEQVLQLKNQVQRLEDHLLQQTTPGAKPFLREEPIGDWDISLDSETTVRPVVTPSAVLAKSNEERIALGMRSSRSRILQGFRALFSKNKSFGPEFYGELEELLITSDLGVSATQTVLNKLKASEAEQGAIDEKELKGRLEAIVREIVSDPRPVALAYERDKSAPTIVFMVGVNGAGKTTTIGKLASRLSDQGARVLIAAADTFRAAATEQVQIWGERSDVEVVSGPDGCKPSTVLFDALQRIKDGGYDVLLVDTAGRLHTRTNLMNELEALYNLAKRELPSARVESMLIIDGSTGQNALQQAREFDRITNVTGLIVTKLDGTYKGGIVVAIKQELGIPIRYIGVGEAIEDLREFSADDFTAALFESHGDEPEEGSSSASEARKVERKRR